MKKLLFLLVLVFILPIYSASFSSRIIGQVEGDDWWLPSNTQKSNNSGIYDYPSNILKPEAYALNLTRKEINPQEGVYNWTRLEEALKAGQPFWVRIFSSDVIHCPDWLPKKYPDLKTFHYKAEGGYYKDTINGHSPGKFYALWHKGFEAEFRKFLLEFKKHHFAQRTNFIFMYYPGAWRWNEWEMAFVKDIKALGTSSEEFIAWFKRHTNDYINAFDGLAYKLLYTGPPQMERCDGQLDWIFQINETSVERNKLADYAISSGMGIRLGALEYFNSYLNLLSSGAPAITVGNYNY